MRRRLGPSNAWGRASLRSKLHNSAYPCPSHPGCAPTSVHLPIKWPDVEVHLENSIRIFTKKGPFARKTFFGRERCSRILCVMIFRPSFYTHSWRKTYPESTAGNATEFSGRKARVPQRIAKTVTQAKRPMGKWWQSKPWSLAKREFLSQLGQKFKIGIHLYCFHWQPKTAKFITPLHENLKPKEYPNRNWGKRKVSLLKCLQWNNSKLLGNKFNRI